MARDYGFAPLVLPTISGQDQKGKVERFNSHLKGSFLVPPAASLKMAGLNLDARRLAPGFIYCRKLGLTVKEAPRLH